MSANKDDALTGAMHENWLNAPNIITLSRLVLSLILFAGISYGGPAWGIPAAILFVIAVVTDAIDGYLARKYNLVTQFGRIVDPFADKFIVCGTFVFLIEHRATSGVSALMAVIVMGREMLVTGIRGFLEQHGKDFSAAWIGKLKMVLQSFALTLALLSLSPIFRDLPSYVLVRDVALWGSVAITVYSGWIYLVRAYQMLRSA